MRSRFAEDTILSALKRGVQQVVILGAGLDTFAYRARTHGNELRIFDVDHPATQQWKLNQLKRTGIDIPSSVTYVPIDLSKDNLSTALAQNEFRLDQCAIFSMMGLVIFLEHSFFKATIEFVASISPRSQIVFDYGTSAKLLNATQRKERDLVVKNSQEQGEPYLTFLDPGELTTNLSELGFANIEMLDPHEMDKRYLQNRTDSLSVPRGGRRLVTARTA